MVFEKLYPEKEDFIVIPKSEVSDIRLNKSLWEKLGKPPIDKNNPPACINLSLKDLSGEQWKPIPNFEDRYVISDKGRVKRLRGWTSGGRKVFLKEQILSQIMNINSNKTYSLYAVLNYNGERTCITITRLLYYCFIEEFDIFGKTEVVLNRNKPLWDIDVSKLSLHSIYTVLKGKDQLL
jgi:hypothetical protein